MSINAEIERVIQQAKKDWPDLVRDTDDEVWTAWEAVQIHHGDDYKALIASQDVREGMKARALIGLMAIMGCNPYFHLSDLRLSEQLWEFLGDTLGRLANPDADSTAQERFKAERYNHLLCETLSHLPEEKAEKVFLSYRLRDLEVHGGSSSEESGYHPILWLWYGNHMAVKWKRLADARMRKIVVAEESGARKPRDPAERAIIWYIEGMYGWCEECEGEYPPEVFNDQMGFVLSFDHVFNGRRIMVGQEYPFWRRLKAGKNVELQRKFIRMLISRSDDSFRPLCHIKETVQEMIEVIRDSDPGLVKLFKQLLAGARPSEKRRRDQALAVRQLEEALLLQMR